MWWSFLTDYCDRFWVGPSEEGDFTFFSQSNSQLITYASSKPSWHGKAQCQGYKLSAAMARSCSACAQYTIRLKQQWCECMLMFPCLWWVCVSCRWVLEGLGLWHVYVIDTVTKDVDGGSLSWLSVYISRLSVYIKENTLCGSLGCFRRWVGPCLCSWWHYQSTTAVKGVSQSMTRTQVLNTFHDPHSFYTYRDSRSQIANISVLSHPKQHYLCRQDKQKVYKGPPDSF